MAESASGPSLAQPRPTTPTELQAAIAYGRIVTLLPQLEGRVRVDWKNHPTLHFEVHRFLTGARLFIAVPSNDPRFDRIVRRAAEALVTIVQTSTHAKAFLYTDQEEVN